MNKIPQYTKVLTLGSSFTENALVGDVVIQEKIDGSQFRWGVLGDGEFAVASKGKTILLEAPEKMFNKGVEYLVSIKDKILKFPKNTYFYGEYMQREKHNVLTYGRTPQNHIVLFDVMSGGRWFKRKELEKIAKELEIDIVPELFKGKATPKTIEKLLKTKSFLGKEVIEGVAIKNYNETIMLGGFIFPLFTKYVRQEFKERHETEWKTKKPKDTMNLFIMSFKNEARWLKTFQHLRDEGELENSLKDLAKLIPGVQKDIAEEESENIKQVLYDIAIKQINRVAVSGLPEWYKEKLLDNLK